MDSPLGSGAHHQVDTWIREQKDYARMTGVRGNSHRKVFEDEGVSDLNATPPVSSTAAIGTRPNNLGARTPRGTSGIGHYYSGVGDGFPGAGSNSPPRSMSPHQRRHQHGPPISSSLGGGRRWVDEELGYLDTSVVGGPPRANAALNLHNGLEKTYPFDGSNINNNYGGGRISEGDQKLNSELRRRANEVRRKEQQLSMARAREVVTLRSSRRVKDAYTVPRSHRSGHWSNQIMDRTEPIHRPTSTNHPPAKNYVATSMASPIDAVGESGSHLTIYQVPSPQRRRSARSPPRNGGGGAVDWLRAPGAPVSTPCGVRPSSTEGPGPGSYGVASQFSRSHR